MHNLNVCFSPLLAIDRCNNRLNVHACTVAKVQQYAFADASFFCLSDTRGWSLNDPILPGQADSRHCIMTQLASETGRHGFSCIL